MSIPDDDKIYPTHTCFDDAVQLLAGVAASEPNELGKYTLVHAICIFPENGISTSGRSAGELFAHAWVERFTPQGTEALQSGMWRGYRVTTAMPLSQLEAILKPQRRWNYTPQELFEDKVLSTTPGPREPELRALSSPAQVRA